jgi:hypothetical protein
MEGRAIVTVTLITSSLSLVSSGVREMVDE